MAANAKTKKILSSEEYAETKRNLLDQLERNGTVGKYYTDLVNDFMAMWVTQCLLQEDIQHRGVNIKWDNGGGQKGIKKNESVEQSIKVNAQMLKLLSWLKLEPPEPDGGQNEQEEEM